MKTPFPMHRLFGAFFLVISALALAAMLAVALSGCGKKAAAPAATATSNSPAVAPAAPAALPTPAEEEAAKREADARRKQFFGNSPSHYTPQDVKGF